MNRSIPGQSQAHPSSNWLIVLMSKLGNLIQSSVKFLKSLHHIHKPKISSHISAFNKAICPYCPQVRQLFLIGIESCLLNYLCIEPGSLNPYMTLPVRDWWLCHLGGFLLKCFHRSSTLFKCSSQCQVEWFHNSSLKLTLVQNHKPESRQRET